MFKLQSDGKQMSVVNLDRGFSIALNRGSYEMRIVLMDAGYVFDDTDNPKYINLYKPFSLDIDKDLADKLARTTMNIKRPKRVKREKPTEVDTTIEPDEYIPSLMDILLQD